MPVAAGTTHGRGSGLAGLFRFGIPQPEIRRSGAFLGVGLSIGLVLVGLFYVWTRMQLVQIGYAISTLEEKNRDLKKRSNELRLEISSLQSPGELEKKAIKEGLVVPFMVKVVHVPE
jgi:cell division protein FtsL